MACSVAGARAAGECAGADGERPRLAFAEGSLCAISLLKSLIQRQRRAMFIDFPSSPTDSSGGAARPRKQANMPLLRSFGAFFPGFYKHGAPNGAVETDGIVQIILAVR